MIEQANELDAKGRFAEAHKLDRYAERIVTAGYGGGVAEYIGKLLELARSKGIDYMKSRMEESRIVTLNDGTPILKRDDAPQLIQAVVARAKALKLPETKGLAPNAPGKIDARWSGESANRMDEIASGKSSWLNQAKPFPDAMEEKKRKKFQWNPPAKKVDKQIQQKPVGVTNPVEKQSPATTVGNSFNLTETAKNKAFPDSQKANMNSKAVNTPKKSETYFLDALNKK